jgi:hypothetical protein
MANAWYRKGAQKVLDGTVDLTADTIKCVLVDSADYTVNLSTHDALDDVPAGARVGTAQTLGSKTFTDGFFDAADPTFSTVTGDVSEYLLFYKDSGVEATSWLLWLFDTATGLPVTPNGGNIAIVFNASGIVSI